MARVRMTELRAKKLVSKFIEDMDIVSFVNECMNLASFYGKYSLRNRLFFQQSIKKELANYFNLIGGKENEKES